LCNYEFLLAGYGLMYMRNQGIRAFLWGKFLESISLQDWVKYEYILLRGNLESESILTQNVSPVFREVY
jgi:hypothetical protein